MPARLVRIRLNAEPYPKITEYPLDQDGAVTHDGRTQWGKIAQINAEPLQFCKYFLEDNKQVFSSPSSITVLRLIDDTTCPRNQLGNTRQRKVSEIRLSA